MPTQNIICFFRLIVRRSAPVGNTPEGPFKDAIGQPLIDNALMPAAGAEPIDPAVLIDGDGALYLYFGCRAPKVVKLDPSMTKLAGAIQDISLLDSDGNPIVRAQPDEQPVLPQGYGEAPFTFSGTVNITSFTRMDGLPLPRRFMA